MQRNKAQVLRSDKLQQRSRSGQQRRRLIKAPVKAAEYPVEFGHPHGRSETWAGGVFHEASGKVRLPYPGIQRKPRSGAKFVLKKYRRQRTGDALRLPEVLAKRGIARIVKNYAE